MTENLENIYMKKVLNSWFSKSFLDFFFPKQCHICENFLIENETVVCRNCLSHFEFTNKAFIEIEFKRKFNEKKVIEDFTSLFLYDKEDEIQNIVYGLKYKRYYWIGKFFGNLISLYFEDFIKSKKIDLILPVPVSYQRYYERGFNQATEISKPVSKRFNIIIDNNSVLKNSKTTTQTRFKLKERSKNISKSFRLKDIKPFTKKNILILDDIITTGSTINELASLLKSNTECNIYAASVFITK